MKQLAIAVFCVLHFALFSQCPPINAISNGSFENYSSCPTGPSAMSLANGWIQASSSGTSDYYNCSFSYEGTFTNYLNIPPAAPPNGTGYAGFDNRHWCTAMADPGDISTCTSYQIYKEYIATCLTTPLIAGNSYTFSCYLTRSPYANGNPLISLYGVTNCANLNFAGANCPTTDPDYVLLGSISNPVSSSAWGFYSITFIAPSNITGIAIGPDCNDFQHYGGSPVSPAGRNHYYYIDGLELNIQNTNSPPTPGASSPGPITCSNPNITLTGTGGTTYSWTGPGIVSGATSASPVVNQSGTYNVTVVAANGCSATTNVVVSQNTTPPSPSASSGGVITCSSPNVTLTGGGGGSYSWSGPGIVSGAATANPVVNAGGTYNLTVTDGSNGCSVGTSVVVSQNTTPPSPSASAGGVITCSSPNVTLTGGGGGSYSWTGPGIVSGAATANPVVNAGGTYNLTVTGGNGCTAGASVNVTTNTTPPSPSASAGGVITCSSPNVTLTGGGGGSYSWTGPGIVSGAATANPVVNAGGTYNLTVTGGNGCTAGASVNVTTNTTPPSPTASAGGVITCSSPNVTLTGGGGGSYSWTGPGIVSGAATANPVVNAGGTYNLTVTGGNGCTAGTSVNVTQSTTLPTASSTAGTTNLNCLTTSTSLNGGATGGSSPYSYSWSPATGLSATNISNPTANPSSTQTYVLTVTDDNGCQSTSNVTINVNTTPPSVTASAGSVKTCSNPNVTLSATGGGTYSWTGTGIVSGATTANPVVNQAGTFNVTVTGSNGCTANSSVNVTQNTTVPSIALSTASTLSTTCASPNVNLSATSNANPTTTYTWLTPLSTTLTGNPVNVSATGIYTVFVTNTSNGCNTTTTPTTVQVVADANIPVVTLSANSGTLTCSVTSIGFTANTTASPVTYNWLPTTGILSGANSATPVFNAAGNYSLTVTNTANSCASTGASNVVTIIANNTNPIAGASASSAVLNCTTTSIALTGTGGGNYAWSGPGIVSGGATANATINQPGTYSLVVTNPSNNCSSTNSAIINITQNNTIPSLVLGTASTLSTTCANPTATLTASSSADPSTIYTWLTPSSTTLTGSSVNVTASGVYSVFVINSSNACVNSTIPTTVQVVSDSNIPVVTLSANSGTLTCSVTSIGVTANTTASPVTYNWLPTTGILSGANSATPVFNAAGNYSLTVTNTANSCASTGGANVVTIVANNTNPTAGASASSSVLNCTTTSIPLTGTGGGDYAWSGPGIVSGGATANATINQPGTYSLVVTNPSNNCSSTNSAIVNITQNNTIPSLVLGTASTLSTTCANPTATLTASSSADPSTIYTWLTPLSNTLTGNPVNASAAGVYTVFVTDTNNGCVSSFAATGTTVEIVPDSNIPVVTLSSNNVEITCSVSTPTVIANTSATTVSYNWTPTTGIASGANTNNPSFDAPGTYSLVVTNTVNTCATGPGDYVVTVTTNTNAPLITLSNASNSATLTCSNPVVSITPTINPNTNLTYTWSPSTGLSSNANQAIATVTASGVYEFMVTNTLTGCMSVLDANSSFTIVSNTNSPTVTIMPISSNIIVGCGSSASVVYSATAMSTSGNMSYNWLPNTSTASTASINVGGVQTMSVTDTDNGCVTAIQFTVESNITVPNLTTNATALFPCETNTTVLTATTTETNVSYLWEGQGTSVLNGANTNAATIGSVGIYTITLTNLTTNCINTQTVSVTQASIDASFTTNPNTGSAPLVVDFTNVSNPLTANFNWDFNNNNTSTAINPSYTFNTSGTYTVSLVANLGVCSDTAYAIIVVNEDVTLIIPNFFTPNSDGQNELFFITGIDKYPNNQLEIYNRWGSLVYLKKGYNNTFDGKTNQPSMGNGLLPSGTYFYNLDLGDGNSKPFKGYVEIKY